MSRADIVSRLALAIWLLGMLTIVRSSVRMRVDRRPMCSTVPATSPTFRKSPTRTAWSKMSDAPAITFSSVFCAASATAMPPTPSAGERRRRIDAEMPQHQAEPGDDEPDVDDAAQDAQERGDGGGIAVRNAPPEGAFELRIEDDQE